MSLLVVSVALVLGISALCSLTEAALYSVRMPYVRQLADAGSVAGRQLLEFKLNMERPITTILIVNTVANTAGATVAGAQAREVFGDQSVLGFSAVMVFSAFLTLSVLFFSEILPKVAGVAYNGPVARTLSGPLALVTWLLSPVVWLSQKAASGLQPNDQVPQAPEEEVRQLAVLSAEEGSILPEEADLVRNVLRLNEITAREIMTPRTVVFTLSLDLNLRQLMEDVGELSHTRIPVHGEDPDDWIGVVLKGDILASLARDEFDTDLEKLMKPLGFVPATEPGHRLLKTFLKRREHMLGVVDEYGGVLGVVTLEDVVEELIGEEIVDETDLVVDLQQVARWHGERVLRNLTAGEDETREK